MIEAYFDESGVHDSTDICVIAGYWANGNQWKWFRRRWLGVLANYAFPLEDFHATDVIRATDHRPMLEELVKVIATYHLYPVTVGIVVPDFWSFTAKQREFMTGATLSPKSGRFSESGAPTRPYFVPFGTALQMVTNRTKPGHTANFFFGLDRPMARYAEIVFEAIKDLGYRPGTAWYSQGRLGKPRFPIAKQTPELQAADLLALLSYRHMCERYKAKDWRVRPAGLLLTCLTNSKSIHDHVYMDRPCLQERLEESYRVFGIKCDDDPQKQ